MSDLFLIFLLDGVVFVAWKIQRWEIEDGGSDSKCHNCCLPSTHYSYKTANLRPAGWTSSFYTACDFTKRVTVILSTKSHYQRPLLLSTHHYGSGCKDGSEENLPYETVKRLIRLGSWMQPPRKLPPYMMSLVLWRHKFYLGVSLLSPT